MTSRLATRNSSSLARAAGSMRRSPAIAFGSSKIGDERQRRRLAKRIVAGELSLAKLRVITGGGASTDDAEPTARPKRRAKTIAGEMHAAKAADDALMGARSKLSEGVDDLVDILRQPEMMDQIPEVNRANFAKHLTITKLKIENAIAIIRAGAPQREEAE